jgi:hypothetical protein
LDQPKYNNSSKTSISKFYDKRVSFTPHPPLPVGPGPALLIDRGRGGQALQKGGIPFFGKEGPFDRVHGHELVEWLGKITNLSCQSFLPITFINEPQRSIIV